MSTQNHEPRLVWARPGSRFNEAGSHWTHVPTCSCGWHGHPTFDKGEATRTAYAHANRAQQPLHDLPTHLDLFRAMDERR